MIPHIIDYRPVYASTHLTVQECRALNFRLGVDTTVSGDSTTKFTSPPVPENLTTVALGTGF